MTGPATGGTERGTRAPSRLTGTQGAVGALLVVLALGLALRLILAYLFPGSGFGVDLNAFQFWAANLAAHGPQGFYDRDFFHDYTPGYLYVLWLIGLIGQAVGGVGVGLIKIPAILADLVIGWLVWSMLLELGARRSLALGAAFVAVVNPISWFDSVVWGQVDSVGVVFLLLGLRDLWRDRPERSAIFAVIAALIKPQLAILIPLVVVLTIRRALWPVRQENEEDESESASPAEGVLARLRAWERRTDHPIRIVTTGLVAIATTILLCLPFGLSVVELSSTAPFFKSGLLSQVFATASGYPYLTVNAFNPWALVAGDTGNSLANSGLWVCDGPWGAATCGSGVASFGPIPAVLVGSVAMLAVVAVVALLVARRPDRLTLLLGLTVLAIAFYVVPTRVHERYAYPAFALAVMLAAIAWRWRIAYAVFSVTVLLNMYAALTNPFYDNPGISDWLGIGPALRTALPIAMIAIVNAVVFLWAVAQLRPLARDRLADELEDASEFADTGDDMDAEREGEGAIEPVPPAWEAPAIALAAAPGVSAAAPPGTAPSPLAPAASAGAAVATMPRWTTRPTFDELGVIGWFKARYSDPPVRPDRSATLRHEGGGRLDQLDLWIVVVLIIGTMVLRTFRLDQPQQMHFDEVYHARTATEFLQDWRYGISHDIYEWTHPHLAKYLMAAGIVLWGGDHVDTTSDLGVPVVATAVEARRIDEAAASTPTGALSDTRAGERLHVATGSEIRTYDLRTRQLISTLEAPGASALAIDDTNQRLVIGYEDGRLATVDLDQIGVGGAAPTPTDLAKVDHAITHLLVVNAGAQVIAASDSRLTSVDAAAGKVIGSLDLAGIADLAPGGSGEAVVATKDDVTDPSAVAASLATILGTSAPDLNDKLASASPRTTVVLGAPGTDDVRTKLDFGHRRREAARDPGGLGDPGRGRDRCRRRVRRPGSGDAGDDDQARWRRSRPGAGHRHRRSQAVRHLRRSRRPELRRHRDRRRFRPRTARPTRLRALACSHSPDPGRGWPTTRPARWSTSLAWCRTRHPPRDRGRSTWSSRTATRSMPTRGCPTASCRARGARTSTPTTRPKTASSSSCSTAPAHRPRSTPGRTPSHGGSPGSSPAR